jgi:aryl-alcohol dehydrogenase-like predicted oxidoreductase
VEPTTIAGITVSPIGLGTGRLASLGAGHSFGEAARLLDVASDLGVTFIDTADTYGSMTCERWLGKAMQGRSYRFVVATKCGLATAHLRGPLRPLNQPAKKILQRIGQDHYLEPGYVRRSIDGSLRRLRRERIEFFFLHEPPPGVEHMDALFEVLEEAKTNGKINAYGVCSPDLRVIDAMTRVRKCTIAQTAVDPHRTKVLVPFLNSANELGDLELMAHGAIRGGRLLDLKVDDQACGTGCRLPQYQERASSPSFSKVQRLVRHAAAVEQVRAVLIGTANPLHLAEAVAALATPTTNKDLLT